MAEELGEILGFDHIEVTVPRGGEARAKRFYGEVLGLREVAPPADLATQGGMWYRCGGRQLYVALNDDFSPQRTTRFAFLVRELDTLQVRLEAAGAPVTRDAPLPGVECIASSDPFGNRMELLMRLSTPANEPPAPDARPAPALHSLSPPLLPRPPTASCPAP